jgi:N-acetylmuramoyl-L-alanine amidase
MVALGFTNRGVKRKNWAVISRAKKQGVSSALFETCFLDDADDMKIYDKNKKAVAKGVAKAIADGFKIPKK